MVPASCLMTNRWKDSNSHIIAFAACLPPMFAPALLCNAAMFDRNKYHNAQLQLAIIPDKALGRYL